jgi:hypothetical protein
MKKLIVIFLALALAVGCGQIPTEETNEGTGGENQPVENIDTTTEENVEFTAEPISLSSLTPSAIELAFELNFVPGIHQLVDEENERTFLLVTLPHVSLGTSLNLTEFSEGEEGYLVTAYYTEVEGENRSMFNQIYELSHTMDTFKVTDQHDNVWASSTFNSNEIVSFDPKYRVDGSLDQNLRISSPGYNQGLSEASTAIEVKGIAVSTEPIVVSLIQGEQVISTQELELTGTEGKWIPFTLSLSLEGITTEEGSEDLRLVVQSEIIDEDWLVSSF